MKRFLAMLLAVLCVLGASTALAANKVGGEFHDGLAWFQEGELYGFIDTAGNIVIKPQYKQAVNFHNGYALVNTGASKGFTIYQMIDTTGKVVAKAPASTANKVMYSLADEGWFGSVGLLERWNYNSKTKAYEPVGYQYVNGSGKAIVKTVFTHVTNFDEEGYAVVGTGKLTKKGTRVSFNGARMIAYLNGNNFTDVSTTFYFMDQKGKQLGKATYTTAPHSFSEGLAAVPGKANAKGVSNWGYIDNKGKEAIKAQFTSAEDFHDGRAKVSVGGKYGYINKAGDFIIEPRWDAIGDFSDGLAWVKKGDKYGYIDENDQLVSDVQWSRAYNFSGGLACVKEAGDYGKCGYIGKDGQFVITPVYDNAYSFTDGYAAVYDGVSWGAIDQKGEVVVPIAYEKLTNWGKGLFSAKEFSAPMIVNEKGDVITVVLQNGSIPTSPIKDGTTVNFVKYPEMDNGLQLGTFVDENGKTMSMNVSVGRAAGESFHITTGSGKLVILTAKNGKAAGTYDEITSSKMDGKVILTVKIGSKYGYVDQNGEAMTKVEYDKAGIFSDGVAIVWQGSQWYIINAYGSVIF